MAVRILPDEMKSSSHLCGVELDSLTGRIAKAIYPDAEINVQGFEDTRYLNNSFDLAVGNVPFGNYHVNDKGYNEQHFLIHDYFIAKMLDQVRPNVSVMDDFEQEENSLLANHPELLQTS